MNDFVVSKSDEIHVYRRRKIRNFQKLAYASMCISPYYHASSSTNGFSLSLSLFLSHKLFFMYILCTDDLPISEIL